MVGMKWALGGEQLLTNTVLINVSADVLCRAESASGAP